MWFVLDILFGVTLAVLPLVVILLHQKIRKWQVRYPPIAAALKKKQPPVSTLVMPVPFDDRFAGAPPRATKKRTCNICMESKPWTATNFVSLSSCHHELCRPCLIRHAETQPEQGRVLTLRCPFYHQCKTDVADADARALLPVHVFERYLSLRLSAGIASMPDVFECPWGSCRYAVLLDPAPAALLRSAKAASTEVFPRNPCGQDIRRLACPLCKRASCLICSRNWTLGYPVQSHDGKSCLQHRAVLSDADHSSVIWITEFSKPCPTCRAPIQKDGGCDHVLCRACKISFCYRCLVPIKNAVHECKPLREERKASACLLYTSPSPRD
mgnify:CR=1 FL=1